MSHCAVCNSDDLSNSTSLSVRVMVALFMVVVIPYGILGVWIPFLIPHGFLCRRCGNETKEKNLNHSDWRERQKWIEEEKILTAFLSPLENQWIDDGKDLKKVVYFHGIWIAYTVDQKEGKAYVIKDVDREGAKVILGGEVKFPNVKYPSGVKTFLTDKEWANIQTETETGLRNFIRKEGRLHPIATERL